MGEEVKKDAPSSNAGKEDSKPDSKDSKDLEDKDWYHGLRPRRDILSLVKEPGDFLVRASDSGGTTEIVLSVMDVKKKHVNISVRREENMWCIGQAKGNKKIKKFATVVELVEFYQKNTFTKKFSLTRPILRPQWLIKHSQVNYDVEKDKLGAGNFCNVYKGTYKRNEDTVTVAIKMSLAVANATEEDKKHQHEATKSMLHEAQLMSFYTHENVIAFYGVACDHPPILIVAELCPGGDLVSHLQKFGKDIDVSERVLYCLEASKGMNYLHGKNCVHRDLAARNCLISDKGTVKIADFGLSKLMEGEGAAKDGDLEDNSSQIPLRWTAPECLTVKASERKYSTKSDVWSYAVLMYEVFSCGEKPFPNDPNKYIATQIRRGRMPPMSDLTPERLRDLVAKMWQVDPEKRPTMRAIGLILKEVHRQNPIRDMDAFTLNKIKGVSRTIKMDDTSEFEDSEGGTNEQKSTDGPGGANKPSIKRTKKRNAKKSNSNGSVHT